ncbi:phosphonate C-P lyase system protein PhnH [Shimia aestuarii]|uniref:Alpha-D-ribose 1-methylphosphonate 5-triphosphate synthase subunit PhnH n=1 Tax=Shimia aestuarii TaxID=254406 RepID=A0A1I4SVX4_9RHOB|nr:phosphonate C-P lyase system protein PhnH [Shimia aestuarii]SFM68537.1 alpha-D-ribose 1-methylphosphonate 5-triphosphate synthase subunit PhnH [Shimia aestuarii]
MDADLLRGGFTNAPVDAAHAFRAAMNVMARPGTVETLAGAKPPAPLSVAAGVLLLTLCDPETPVFLAGVHDCAAVRDWITFHVGAPLIGPERSVFAVGGWDDLMPLDRFTIGTPEYPDRSATMIVEEGETPLVNAILRGPGIRSTAAARLPELDAFQRNAALFPLGLDFFFTQGGRVRAVPRTTKVEAA